MLGTGIGMAAKARSRILRACIACAMLAAVPHVAVGGDAPTSSKPPTYTDEVAAILGRRCCVCHRSGGVGPFRLETYEQARKRSKDIALVAGERSMPPWKPERGVGPGFEHDTSLPPAEIAHLKAWANAGAPLGDAKRVVGTPAGPDRWKLGTPDLVLDPGADFAIAADAKETYRCFVMATSLPDDAWITAIELLPSNRRVVHHINAYVDMAGDARRRDEAEAGPGYTSYYGPGSRSYMELGFWAAGHEPGRLPEGVGQRLPKGSDIVLQVHYEPTGKPETDRTLVGLYLARRPVRQSLHWCTASNSEFRLPAGEKNIEVRATWFVPTDVEAIAVSPHMHRLGSDMRMVVIYPDGRKQDLINIPEWDPAWQGTYRFRKPITLPRGSTVQAIAHFDNSAHARNPNSPPKNVGWGYGSTDEMCEGFIAVVKKGQDLTRPRTSDEMVEILRKQRMRNAVKRPPSNITR